MRSCYLEILVLESIAESGVAVHSNMALPVGNLNRHEFPLVSLFATRKLSRQKLDKMAGIKLSAGGRAYVYAALGKSLAAGGAMFY